MTENRNLLLVRSWFLLTALMLPFGAQAATTTTSPTTPNPTPTSTSDPWNWNSNSNSNNNTNTTSPWGSPNTNTTSPWGPSGYSPYGTATPTPTSGPNGAPGSDGLEFQVLPLDYRTQCNSMLLRATKKFPNTAFLLPRGVLALNKQSNDLLFEIIPTPKGQFLLRFGMYFPRANEDVDFARENSHLNLKSCDVRAVVDQLNRNAKDDGDKIKLVSPLPVTGIGVRVDGIDRPYIFGTSETQLANYQGKDIVAEFVIPDRDSMDMILKRMESDLGLQIYFDFKFAARSSNGAMVVHLDSDRLLAGLMPSIGGNLGGFIAAGQLQGQLAKIIGSMGADVYTEDSTSMVFNQLAANLIGMLIMSDPNAIQNNNGGMYGSYGGYGSGYGYPYSNNLGFGTDPSSWGNYGNTWGGYGNTIGNTYGSPWGSTGGIFTNPIYTGGGYGGGGYDPTQQPGMPPQGPYPGPGSQLMGPMIRVSSLVQYIKNKRNIDLKYDNMSRAEARQFTDSINVRASVGDPGQSQLKLYSLSAPATYQSYIKAGTSLSIFTVDHTVEKNNFRYDVNYFSLDDIRAQRLDRYFPKLGAQDQKFVQIATAQGPRALMFSGTDASSLEFLIWGSQDLKSKPELQSHDDLFITRVNESSIPVEFTFSKVGPKPQQLAMLSSSNDYWDGKYDELGTKYTITAKRDLGTFSLRNTETFPSKNVITRQFFQQRWKRGQDSAAETLQSQDGVERSTVAQSRSVIKLKIDLESAQTAPTPAPISVFPTPTLPTSPNSTVVVP